MAPNHTAKYTNGTECNIYIWAALALQPSSRLGRLATSSQSPSPPPPHPTRPASMPMGTGHVPRAPLPALLRPDPFKHRRSGANTGRRTMQTPAVTGAPRIVVCLRRHRLGWTRGEGPEPRDPLPSRAVSTAPPGTATPRCRVGHCQTHPNKPHCTPNNTSGRRRSKGGKENERTGGSRGSKSRPYRLVPAPPPPIPISCDVTNCLTPKRQASEHGEIYDRKSHPAEAQKSPLIGPGRGTFEHGCYGHRIE